MRVLKFIRKTLYWCLLLLLTVATLGFALIVLVLSLILEKLEMNQEALDMVGVAKSAHSMAEQMHDKIAGA